jgi:DNA-directed RNA polymerase specialized sigma subunit
MNNYEKVEKLLEDYAELDINIKGLEYQIKVEGVKGISYNDMPGSPLPSNKSSIEQELIKIDELKKDKIRLEIKKEGIDNVLNLLSKFEKDLIKYIYIDKLKYKEIENKLSMSKTAIIYNKNKLINDKLIRYFCSFNLI